VQGNVKTFHAFELVAQALLARVHHHLAALTEQQILDGDEAVERILVHLTREHFVDLALVDEGHAVTSRVIHTVIMRP